MDFVPPPDRDNFQTEDEYKKAKEKWEREFKRAKKNMVSGHRVSQHDRSKAIITISLDKYKI